MRLFRCARHTAARCALQLPVCLARPFPSLIPRVSKMEARSKRHAVPRSLLTRRKRVEEPATKSWSVTREAEACVSIQNPAQNSSPTRRLGCSIARSPAPSCRPSVRSGPATAGSASRTGRGNLRISFCKANEHCRRPHGTTVSRHMVSARTRPHVKIDRGPADLRLASITT